MLSSNYTPEAAGFMDQAYSGRFYYKFPVRPQADHTLRTIYPDLAIDESTALEEADRLRPLTYVATMS